MKFELSNRIKRLPPYLFSEIDRIKGRLRKNGVNFIDLSIGDPDIQTPKGVIEILHKSSKIKDNQKYALDRGKGVLRKEICRWVKHRFGVI